MGRTSLQEDLFLVIAHPIRRAILVELRSKDTPATQLAAHFDITLSAISQHLKALKGAGLVSEHRNGRQRIYSLQAAPLREISNWVDEFSLYWPKKMESLGEHLRRNRKK